MKSKSSGILIVLFLGVLMAALDIAIVGPALPALREHYGLTERTVAWVFNMFVLFNLLGLPLMARLSDTVGRRTMYAVNVGLFAGGSLIVAAGPPFAVVLVGRAIQGLGASGIFPVASAVVGDVVVPERRGRALGILGAVFGIAFIIGPIIAGILLLVGWQWLFLVNLPLALLVIVGGLRILPDTYGAGRSSIDWTGIAVIGGLLAMFAYGINQLDTERLFESLISWRVLPWLVASFLLVPVFVRVERRSADPLLRLSLLQNRQVLISSLLGIGAGLTEAGFVFMPAMAVEAFGVTKSSASFMLLPLVAAVAIGAPVGGRLLDRVGSRLVILASTVILAAGLLTLGLGPTTREIFYVSSVLIGLGLSGLLGSSLSYILLHESEEKERTVAQGIGTLAISVGQLTGGAFIGAVITSVGAGLSGYRSAFTAIGLIAAVLFVVSFGLKRREAEFDRV